MTTFSNVTYKQFTDAYKEFEAALPTLPTDGADNGFKALTLMWLGRAAKSPAEEVNMNYLLKRAGVMLLHHSSGLKPVALGSTQNTLPNTYRDVVKVPGRKRYGL